MESINKCSEHKPANWLKGEGMGTGDCVIMNGKHDFLNNIK